MTSLTSLQATPLETLWGPPSFFSHQLRRSLSSLSPHPPTNPFLLWLPEQHSFQLLDPSLSLLLPGSYCGFSSMLLKLGVVLGLSFNLRPQAFLLSLEYSCLD